MAKCPACEHDIATPFVLNEDKWRWFACPHLCGEAREKKAPAGCSDEWLFSGSARAWHTGAPICDCCRSLDGCYLRSYPRGVHASSVAASKTTAEAGN